MNFHFYEYRSTQLKTWISVDCHIYNKNKQTSLFVFWFEIYNQYFSQYHYTQNLNVTIIHLKKENRPPAVGEIIVYETTN